jgi:hypothetical protein
MLLRGSKRRWALPVDDMSSVCDDRYNELKRVSFSLGEYGGSSHGGGRERSSR